MKVLDLAKLAQSFLSQGEIGKLASQETLNQYLKIKELGAKDDDDIDEFIDNHPDSSQLKLDYAGIYSRNSL